MASPHWLPDRHLGVAATLAHVDEVISSVGELLFEYQTAPSGIMRLREDLEGNTRHLVVEGVAPIPSKVPLLAADALNALRAAIEHTIYIEAEAASGQTLDEKAARLVEMPAAWTDDSFAQWLKKRAKNGPAALRKGADLQRRIYELQPLHRHSDPGAHPLARLVAYTNNSKHRTPAITAVRIPVISRGDARPQHPRDIPARPEEPILPGQIIFSAPVDQVVPLDIFPTVGIHLPGIDAWPILMKELGELAAWVRTQAIPRLITGSEPPKPEIPAWHEISQGHSDPRAAIVSGMGVAPAYDRNRDRLGAAHARLEFALIIGSMPLAPSRLEVLAWLESLPDSEVLRRVGELGNRFDLNAEDIVQKWDVFKKMLDDAVAFARQCDSGAPVTPAIPEDD